MSRGLGKREREILESLRLTKLCAEVLGLTWHVGGSFTRKYLVSDARDIVRFESGDIVEVRRLRRETGMSAAVLSRTLRTMERKELLFLYRDGLQERHYEGHKRVAVKFAGLTDQGEAVANSLSANKGQKIKLALKPANAAPSLIDWQPS